MKNIFVRFFHHIRYALVLMTGTSLLSLSAQQPYDFECTDASWYPSGGISTNSVPFSYFGDVHTPKGDLHILIIFVIYNPGIDVPDPAWGTIWPDDASALPTFAKPPIGQPTLPNELFNTDPTTIAYPNSVQNLSEYYYVMSGGAFRLTADVYPTQVRVDYVSPPIADFTRLDIMNKQALAWIAANDPTFDWSKYDNRTNFPFYSSDNQASGPDNKIDYVVFMHRAAGEGGGATPVGSAYNIPNTPYTIQNGGGPTALHREV